MLLSVHFVVLLSHFSSFTVLLCDDFLCVCVMVCFVSFLFVFCVLTNSIFFVIITRLIKTFYSDNRLFKITASISYKILRFYFFPPTSHAINAVITFFDRVHP